MTVDLDFESLAPYLYLPLVDFQRTITYMGINYGNKDFKIPQDVLHMGKRTKPLITSSTYVIFLRHCGIMVLIHLESHIGSESAFDPPLNLGDQMISIKK